MRALRIHGYGGPEVMRLEEIARPQPGPGEIGRDGTHAEYAGPIEPAARKDVEVLPTEVRATPARLKTLHRSYNPSSLKEKANCPAMSG